MRKRFKYPLVFVVIAIILATPVWCFLPQLIIAPYRNTVSTHPQDFPFYGNPENLGLKYDSLAVKGYKNIRLNGYFFYTPFKSKGTIIFSHGIGGCKEHFLHEAKKVCQLGFNAVVYDIRAHGTSEGEYGTYGYFEKHDLRFLIDYLTENYGCENIGAWGVSYGGAITMQAMAIDDRIHFGLIQSTFSDLRTIVNDYHDRVIRLHIPGLADSALDRAAKTAHFNPESVLPKEAAKKISQPIFMSHGTKDQHIAISYGKENFDALASKHKFWHPVAGAEHNNLPQVGGEEYWAACKDFLNTYGTQIEINNFNHYE